MCKADINPNSQIQFFYNSIELNRDSKKTLKELGIIDKAKIIVIEKENKYIYL